MSSPSLRIVSLEPSITAMLFALGAADHLLAVSSYCHRLVDVGDKPQLSTTWSAKADQIRDLSPDLVLASVPYRLESIAELLQARLNLLCLYPQYLRDVYHHITWLGRLTGKSAIADQLVTDMQAELAAMGQSAGNHRPRVYVEIWPQPMMTGSPWVAELVDLVGGQFVPPEPGRTVTEEEIRQVDPEIIVVAWAGVAEPPLSDIQERAGWSEVTAVREGRVVAVNEINLNAPGPNLVAGARQLADIIHRM